MKGLSADTSAALAAAAVLTGVQGIAPALPTMQAELGLTELELSLLVVGYLIPGALFAFPAGVVADRIGLNRVTAAALLVFGVCGALAFFWHGFEQLLLIRTVQGAMFGSILALTIASVSHSASERRATAAQSKRVVIMAIAESLAPLAAGVIVASLDWNAVFLLQMLALPIAVLCYRTLPRSAVGRANQPPTRQIIRESRRAVLSPSGMAVQAPGFLRFFLKYALLTFVPILAAATYGMGPAEIGLMLALASLGGVCAAAAAPWLRAGRVSIGVLLAIAMTVTALPIVLMPLAGGATLLTVLVVVSGAGDGLLAVVNNVTVTQLAPRVGASAFIGITGGIRTAGKLSAPVLAGALAGVFPLAAVLGTLGVLGLASLGVVPRVSRLLAAADEASPAGEQSST